MFPNDHQTSIPMHERLDLLDDAERFELLHMIDFARQNRRLHEALYQLHNNGPVWDGDVVSKTYRSDLLDIGACAKVIVKRQEGFNACTYLGRRLLRIYDWLYGALPGAEALK
ncbi:MAG: hypothetical protein EOO12_00025 [Chitinophagaceae bacterium]|nr:MAG: hypothetical protein EOO12_00025 [Chitinophagaceae bacterium]